MVKSKSPYELMQTMRSSIFFAAPILARVGQVEISNPGGCRLGERPIDIHLAGLCAMGAYVQEMPQGKVVITAPQGLM
ncbi:MAG: UDP-N-acetylglucosamine 1-carboxyvinyltransferase, partial [Oscillospiraceae bacterium]